MKSYPFQIMTWGLLLVLFSGLTMTSGCSETKPKEQSNTDTSKKKKNDDKRLCEANLENILSVVDLENLAAPFQRSNGVIFFNEWKTDCQVEDDLKLSEISKALLKEAFSEESMTRVMRKDFDGRDVAHLRTALLLRKMALNTIKGTKNELERVMALYQLAIRNVSITPVFAQNVPRTPYDSMLLSLGGVEDRTWIFSLLLRQIHIDSFLIRPDEKSTRFLIGVPLNKHVYLFEPAVGVPVAPLETKNLNAFIKIPATLKQLRYTPDLLNQFSLQKGFDYPLAKANFSKIHIDLIGDSSLWASRMEPFESRLKGDETCTVYSTIESKDPDQELGEINRILKNGGLDEKNIKWGIWKFPESMLLRYENPTPQEKQFMASVYQAFDIIFRSQRKNKADAKNIEEEKSDKAFLQARTRHLTGNYSDSIPSYMKFRMGGRKLMRENNNTSQATLVKTMGQQAHYWTGLCQFEQKKFGSAINTMNNSLRDYPNGLQNGPARIVKALAHAQINELKAAIETFKQTPESSSEYDLALYYIKRWEKILKAKSDSKKPKVEKPKTKTPKKESKDKTSTKNSDKKK